MIEHVNEVVFLPQLAVTGPVIAERSFANCRVLGPALCALLDSVHVTGCSLGGALEELLVEVPEGRVVIGAIGLLRCEFVGCLFEGVGWIGTQQSLDLLRVGSMRL